MICSSTTPGYYKESHDVAPGKERVSSEETPFARVDVSYYFLRNPCLDDPVTCRFPYALACLPTLSCSRTARRCYTGSGL